MIKKEFKINIKAPRNLVWHVLWSDITYRQWTSVFHEGSYADSDWNEGSEIKFLGPGGSGMYAIIDKKEEPSFMTFKHIGEIKEGEKQPESNWAGAKEAYALVANGNTTEVIVNMDISEEWLQYFDETFPKALQKVKEITESDGMKSISIEASVNAPVDKVWIYWNDPVHITKWNSASPDWHTPRAQNDLRVGGKLQSRMEAKDGSMGFDFEGTYDVIKINNRIEYTIADGRKVKISFVNDGNNTKVVETFETEGEFPIEMQRGGWQAILNNFKKYTETN